MKQSKELLSMAEEMERRADAVRTAVGKDIVRRRDRVRYLLESFDEKSGECVLIPRYVRSRKTRKWYGNLFLDYELCSPQTEEPS